MWQQSKTRLLDKKGAKHFREDRGSEAQPIEEFIEASA
jgi:hypothetical protein